MKKIAPRFKMNMIGMMLFISPMLLMSQDMTFNEELPKLSVVCRAAQQPLMTCWYADADADGLGDALNVAISYTQPRGFVANSSDLDDSFAQGVFKPQSENMREWYLDADDDGFGDALNVRIGAIQPIGYTDNFLDNNDNDAKISIGLECGICMAPNDTKH